MAFMPIQFRLSVSGRIPKKTCSKSTYYHRFAQQQSVLNQYIHYIHTFSELYTQYMHIHMYPPTCTYTRAGRHAKTFMRVEVCTQLYLQTYRRKCACLSMYIYTRVHVYLYVYISRSQAKSMKIEPGRSWRSWQRHDVLLHQPRQLSFRGQRPGLLDQHH